MTKTKKSHLKKSKKNNIFSLGVIVLIIGSFFLGTQFDFSDNIYLNVKNKEDIKIEKQADFAPFWKTWKLLEEKFVKDKESEDEEITPQDKVWGAIQGLTSSFGDPYTVFLPPTEAEMFKEDIKGNFEGVGMEIGIMNNQIVVIAPLKDTPAERAGMKPKDVILKIDGKSTKNMDTTDAVKLIRGEKGTEVVLLVERDGKEKPFEVSITRDVINFPVIKTEKRDSHGKESKGKIIDGVFIIRMYSFTATSPNLFREALREFISNPKTNKLILDLRGNPGGYLEAANDIASWFLPIGKTVVTEDYGGKEPNYVHKSKGYNIFNDNLKMAILVDEGSASASEILAGALKEYGIATLIGTTTFGKGSVQQLMEVTPDTSLKVTVARWLTPKGNSFSHTGIEPDIEVEISEDDLEYIENGGDPQMDKAIEYLNNL